MRVLAETSNLSPLCSIWSVTGDNLRLYPVQNAWCSFLFIQARGRLRCPFILGHGDRQSPLQGRPLPSALVYPPWDVPLTPETSSYLPEASSEYTTSPQTTPLHVPKAQSPFLATCHLQPEPRSLLQPSTLPSVRWDGLPS